MAHGTLWALALLHVAVVAAVTPVEKVITLLEDLKGEVEKEGKKEAGTYDTFACFCKDTTTTKSDAIKGGQDKIDSLSASIEENTAFKAEKATELAERKTKQEELAEELEETTARCAKEDAEFEAQIADLTKAVNSLDKAVTALEKAKPALIQSQREALREAADSVALAEALGLGLASGAARAKAFLQQAVDPSNPDYKFKSDGVIDTLKTMLTDFRDKKKEVEDEWTKSKKACKDLKDTLTKKMEENDGEMTTLKKDIDGLEKKISEDRGALVSAEDTLKDDQLYLKDLTVRCELAARDWDQRSAGRGDELKALQEALAVLTEGKDGSKSIQELDAVNNRSFVQKKAAVQPPASGAAPASAAGRPVASSSRRAAAAGRAGPVLLQARRVRRALRGRSSMQLAAASDKAGRAGEMLHSEGIRLKSQMLTSLASQVMADPFAKVKGLIQQLIQRLLDEATQEATKKGFCDMEVGKAKKNRDHRFADIKRLSAELNVLKAKKDELNQTIEELKEDIPKLYDTLNKTTEQREDEKEQNLDTIKLAKEGAKAVKDAITILKVYYKSASRASVLLQASPVDEDTDGPGFSGAYKGKQAGADGVVGLLEVIQSDFLRTVKMTQQAESRAQREFVEFDQTSRSDISGKEMSLELNTQDLKATANAIEQKMEDLTTGQSLLDEALKAIEDLKPMCIDTSMSYSERVEKREAEIAALKKAMCLLDPDGAESECA